MNDKVIEITNYLVEQGKESKYIMVKNAREKYCYCCANSATCEFLVEVKAWGAKHARYGWNLLQKVIGNLCREYREDPGVEDMIKT